MTDKIEQIKQQLVKDIFKLLKENGLAENSNAYQFVYAAYVEKKSFPNITKSLSETRATLTQWNTILEPVWRKLTEIRALHKRKQISIENFWDFYLWHTTSKRQCQYCGITAEEIMNESTQQSLTGF